MVTSTASRRLTGTVPTYIWKHKTPEPRNIVSLYLRHAFQVEVQSTFAVVPASGDSNFCSVLKQYPRQITGCQDARCRWRNMRTIEFFKGYDSLFRSSPTPFDASLVPRFSLLPVSRSVGTGSRKPCLPIASIRQWLTANVAERKSAVYEIPLKPQIIFR